MKKPQEIGMIETSAGLHKAMAEMPQAKVREMMLKDAARFKARKARSSESLKPSAPAKGN